MTKEVFAISAAISVVWGLLVYGLVSWAQSSPDTHHSDAEFRTACLSHNFTADQCEFFRHGPEGERKDEGVLP